MRKETYLRLNYPDTPDDIVSDSRPDIAEIIQTKQDEISWRHAAIWHQANTKADDAWLDYKNYMIALFVQLAGTLIFTIVMNNPVVLIYMVFVGGWVHSTLWALYCRSKRKKIRKLSFKKTLTPHEKKVLINACQN